jgi:hypothetical protein
MAVRFGEALHRWGLLHHPTRDVKPNQDPAQLRLSLIALLKFSSPVLSPILGPLLSWDTHSLPIGASLVGAC